MVHRITRRAFNGLLVGGAANASYGVKATQDLLAYQVGASADSEHHGMLQAKTAGDRIDLSPATWMWFPSERTIPNTFVLFRRELVLDEAPALARGWITADSRYRLTVNGRRIQWGPAPCDPRWPDVDPVDITSNLTSGRNVIGIEVLYFGLGESTWVTGKPGTLFSLEIRWRDGRVEHIYSDESWRCFVDRAHRPGQYKRWYLRALQEEFDARQHPYGWDTPAFQCDDQWIRPMKLDVPASKPSICGQYFDYLEVQDVVDASDFFLRTREIPLLREFQLPAMRLAGAGRVEWLRDPDDWFEFRTPGSFRILDNIIPVQQRKETWLFPATRGLRDAIQATFEFEDEVVGFPYFTIDAAEGTIVEMICQELHDPAHTAWLDTHWYCWARFICREGENRFESFDYEPMRWMQLHIRNARRPVTVNAVGVRRRIFPWPNEPHIRCSEPPLQRLFSACINNLHNSAQETSSDPGREREQYGGAGSLQLIGVRYAFGEAGLPRRVLRTYSEGISQEGYFLDPWPAFDMLERFGQLQIGTSIWGSQIDEGVTFIFNCWLHYLYTGDLDALGEIYPRLLRLADFLARACGKDGLLPLDHVGGGVLNVWLDDDAFQGQKRRVRQCPFNLHTAAILQHGLAPLALAFGDAQRAASVTELGRSLQAAAVQRFWSHEHRLFVDNLPWVEEDRASRLCDRTLATALLFDQCPNHEVGPAVNALAEMPSTMGVSYPMNSIWRYWALAKYGKIGVVLEDLRTRWAQMPAVTQNNTLPEVWHPQPDTKDEGCYFEVTPMILLFTDIAGIRPVEPGFKRCEFRPQLSGLGSLELTAHTVLGPIRFSAESAQNGHDFSISIPQRCEAELLLPPRVACELPALAPDHPFGLKRFRLSSGNPNTFFCQI